VEALSVDRGWRRAFEQVPRHVFVPRFWALDDYNSPARLVDGSDPALREEWLDAVYRDQVLITNWVMRDGYRMPTSSASLPTLVAHMPRALQVQDGQRVLEIGTGTGFNTGLLCHRLGDQRVTSVDIDSELVVGAAERLAQLGYRPLLITGDGAEGFAGGAPYDRILCTCASPGVPVAWIEQLAEGGVLVAPLTIGGALAVLTKTGPTQVSGRLDAEQAWFMPLRPDSADPVPEGHLVTLPDLVPRHQRHRGAFDIDPAVFADPDFRLWLALHLPTNARIVDQIEFDEVGGLQFTGVIVHTDRHRAEARFPPGEHVRVVQDSRRLFDHVATAWREWNGTGAPHDGGSGSPLAATEHTPPGWTAQTPIPAGH
jgi:protein-L-isoaspartate(D-aspartate) O-methyltransferase